MLRIALATFYDLRASQGIGAKTGYRVRALERVAGPLEHLGPLHLGMTPPMLLAKWFFYQKLRGKRYFPYRDRTLVKSFGRQLSRKLARSPANVVLSLVSPGSQPVAYLDCRQPIVIWTDSTIAGAIETHPNFARELLCEESLRDALANERAALERCRLAVYLSDWAARSAIKHYGVDPAKIRIVPGGANLDSGLDPGEVEAVVAGRPSDSCRLLFLAARWRDKGGDLALEVANALNRAGLPTTLTVVGARPDVAEPLPPFISVTGPLRKSVPDELATLQRLLREAHFLILPTRADASPRVVCEASAYAVPSLATDVCGVASVVADGRNGKLIPLDAGADAYCTQVEELFRDYGRYQELARSSFDEYATRLNWASAATALRDHMLELL
jgi:glycosyltransferase involved in cell wall biosynthesis